MARHDWYQVPFYELHYADQQHYACEAVQVPVPVHGCVSLSYLRQYFPTATNLHYIMQGSLFSVTNSIPYVNGRFDSSKLVFYLPKDFPVLNILVSCDKDAIKKPDIKFDSMLMFIERLNSKLRSKNVQLDCACMVLDDLYKLMHLVEKETNHGLQLLIKFTRDNWDEEMIKIDCAQKVSDDSLLRNLLYDGIKQTLERINANLRSRNLTLDCTHVILIKLYKLEDWIDKLEDRHGFSPINEKVETVVGESNVAESASNVLVESSTKPKLKRRPTVLGVKKLEKSISLIIDGDREKDCANDMLSDIVSSRPKLRGNGYSKK